MPQTVLPEGAAWSLDAVATEHGVDLVLMLPPEARVNLLGGLHLSLDRVEARVLARALLAAAGDATERTFPYPRLTAAQGG